MKILFSWTLAIPKKVNAVALPDWKFVAEGKQGLSMGKAALGGFLLGPLGAIVGGMGGKRVKTYYCMKCGFSHDYVA